MTTSNGNSGMEPQTMKKPVIREGQANPFVAPLNPQQKKMIALAAASGILLLATLFVFLVFNEQTWVEAGLGGLSLASLAALAWENRKALRSRSVSFGLHSLTTTVLVLSIVGVVNFVGAKHPFKGDFTRNHRHTLSDQTTKLLRELKQPLKLTLYSKGQQREDGRLFLDQLKPFTTQLETEIIDPDREIARARQSGVKRINTLVMGYGDREQKVEDLSEEKFTNALIKLVKERQPALCTTVGHGEKAFASQDADGFEAVKRALTAQSYEVRDLDLAQQPKVPETCDALAIVGPSKAFFPAEIAAIDAYLAGGGRALVALDAPNSAAEPQPELTALLAKWGIRATPTIIIDLVSRQLVGDPVMPLVMNFNRDATITKEFQGNSFLPFTRAIEVIPEAPKELTVKWLAQTGPQSWAERNPEEIKTGKVSFNSGVDLRGPVNVAAQVEGKQKDSKAAKNTRIVVFGSSAFANNQYSRNGNNLDLFANAASWLMEDDALISIRAKGEDDAKIEITKREGQAILWIVMIAMPLLISASGVGIWMWRRRL